MVTQCISISCDCFLQSGPDWQDRFIFQWTKVNQGSFTKQMPLYAARGLVSRAWGLWPPSDGCFEPRVKRASDAECHLCSARVLDSSVGWNSVIFGHRRKHSDKAINLACVYLVRQLQLNKRRTFAFFLHCCRPKLLLKTLKLLKAKNMNYCGYWCLYPLKKNKKKEGKHGY